MECKIVDKNYINKLKIHSINNNSILYVSDEDLIKMPYYDKNWGLCLGEPNISNIEKTIECLEVLDGNYYILPKYSLYTSRVKTSNYKGYGMDYLREYSPIGNNIESNGYTYKEKLEICKNICNAVTRLEKYKIAYWDIHSDNILIDKDRNIKLCDMDSASPLSLYGNLEYKKALLWSYKHLTSLVLAILYGIDEMSLIGYVKDNKDSKFIKESKMFQTIIDDEYHMFYPDKYLDSLTEDYIEDTKLILKKDNYS